MKITDDQRYWLSIAGVVVGTILLAGLAGGSVAMAVGERSLLSGVAIVAILLPGWFIGFRVHERKKLGLPLWRSLSAAQARELAQYREWMRSGRLTEPSRKELAGRPGHSGPDQPLRARPCAPGRRRAASGEPQAQALLRHPAHPQGPEGFGLDSSGCGT